MGWDFTPPTPPAVPEWATYIPGRRPAFKTHKVLGHAKNAFNAWNGWLQPGILYHLQDGEYVEHARVDKRMSKDQHPLWSERQSKLQAKRDAMQMKHVAYQHDAIHRAKRSAFCQVCGEKL